MNRKMGSVGENRNLQFLTVLLFSRLQWKGNLRIAIAFQGTLCSIKTLSSNKKYVCILQS